MALVPAPTRIRVLEDESDIAGLIKHTLERAGNAEVSIVGSGDEALKAVNDSAPDLLILDLNLADDGAAAVYEGKHLRADFDAVAVSVDAERIKLTRREFELLKFLVENRNRVMSRDRLLERVWGYDREVETRSVDVHVGRLRAKLGAAGSPIETVVGLGYRFVE